MSYKMTVGKIEQLTGTTCVASPPLNDLLVVPRSQSPLPEINEVFCQGTTDIVCPYCGHGHDDTDWLCEGNFNDEMECSKCGESFQFEGEASVTWSSIKVAY